MRPSLLQKIDCQNHNIWLIWDPFIINKLNKVYEVTSSQRPWPKYKFFYVLRPWIAGCGHYFDKPRRYFELAAQVFFYRCNFSAFKEHDLYLTSLHLMYFLTARVLLYLVLIISRFDNWHLNNDGWSFFPWRGRFFLEHSRRNDDWEKLVLLRCVW